jgi:cell division protein FtsL
MSAQPAYMMYPERVQERPTRERISVVPGSRTARAPQAVTPVLVLKIVLPVMIALMLVAVSYLFISAATVKTSMQAQALSSQIDEARSTGTSLEVTESLLSNPTRVRQQAEALGMSAPSEVGSISMAADVVVTDESGSLSLSGSVNVVASGE